MNILMVSTPATGHINPLLGVARVLRESGTTPTQTKVGIQLALGKTKPMIADELVPLHKDYDSFVGCALMLAGSG